MPCGTPLTASWHALPSHPIGSMGAAHQGAVVVGRFDGQEFTTFPARSNSTTDGEGVATTVSGETRLPWGPRVTMKMWSLESMPCPATSPVTHDLLEPGPVARYPSVAAAGLVSFTIGSGFGQKGSTLNAGALARPFATAWPTGLQNPNPTITPGASAPR